MKLAQRILITGITGYLGSHLAKRLLDEGCEVHALVRVHSDFKLVGEAKSRVTLHVYDGTWESMDRIVREAKPELCFHLASLFLGKHTPTDITPLITSNVLMGTHLLEALTASGVRYLVNTGTFWQHFEGQAYNPVSLYSATKQAFEDIVRFYTESTSLRCLSLRLFDTYGPGDPRPKVMNLIHGIATKDSSLDMSPGEQLIEVVYVDDVIDAFVRAGQLVTETTQHNAVYQVNAAQPVKLRELVQTYESVTGKKLKINWGKLPYRGKEMFKSWNAYETLPGWTPKTSLEEGIRKITNDSKL